jgi:hypothetical protein
MMAQRTFCNRASDTRDATWEDIKTNNSLPLERYVMEDWQLKVSEQKPVPLLPSNDDPSLSFALQLGDSLSMGGANAQCKVDTPTMHHLFPSLAGKRGGASKDLTVRGAFTLCIHAHHTHLLTRAPPTLTPILQTLYKSFVPGVTKGFENFTVPSMDPSISSHGVRRAVIIEADAAGARLTAIAAFSGHAPEDRGLPHNNALLEYLSSSAQNATPVAAFTVGWPLSERSVYKCTPQFPSLLALKLDQSYGLLPIIADSFFEIFDDITPWLSFDGGRLRGLVESMLAEQIMYFERRKNRYGSSFLPVSKLVGVVADKLHISRTVADATLCRWGTLVHSKFVADNQHSLVDSSLVTTLASLSGNVAELGGSVASLTAAMAAMAQQQAAFMVQQQAALQSMASFHAASSSSSSPFSTSAVQALPMEAFAATARELTECAASAAATADRLRLAGSHVVSPASAFPYSELPRHMASSSSSTPIPAEAAPAPTTTTFTTTSTPAPSSSSSSASPAEAAPAPTTTTFTTTSTPAPSSSSSSASAPHALFMQPLVPVLLDTTSSLSDLYLQYLEGKLSRKNLDKTFFHGLDKKERSVRTRDASSQSEPLDKQKAAKIANGLAAMDALATSADVDALRAAHGSREQPVRQAAHLVCRRLETLLLARLVFMQLQLKMTPVAPARLTPNAFEARYNAMRIIVKSAVNGAAEIEGFLASFTERPKEAFWIAARGGALGGAAQEAAQHAADAISAAEAVAAAAAAAAAAATGGGGRGMPAAKNAKRAREAETAVVAFEAAEVKRRAAAAEAARLEGLVRAAAAESAARAAAVTRPVLPRPVSFFSFGRT